MIRNSILELVGNTPMVELGRIEKKFGLTARILAKLESFNPGGSVKDRTALSMIEDAEKKGVLKPGSTIIEPTSGNTGVGLAWIGNLKGYKVIMTMPETMSVERQNLLRAYGAEVVLTPGVEGMNGSIAKAEKLRKEIPDAVILGQFDNPSNPKAHYCTTGEEIWHDTDGKVDIFIAGVGTGGTVSGTARKLKEYNKNLYSVAVEPAESPVLSGGSPSPHKIQGIGAGFIPANYDSAVIDKIMRISSDDAVQSARILAQEEGILAGYSSGAALSAAIKMAKLKENEGKLIVVLLPDTGERYLSTTLFKDPSL